MRLNLSSILIPPVDPIHINTYKIQDMLQMEELNECLEIRREINRIDERILELKYQVNSPKNQVITGMPKGGSESELRGFRHYVQYIDCGAKTAECSSSISAWNRRTYLEHNHKKVEFNFDDYKGKYVMHCKTALEAKQFSRFMEENRLRWKCGGIRMINRLDCFKCHKDTAILTYEENRIYKVSCPCGCEYDFEHSSWKCAEEYHNKMLELYGEIDRADRLKTENAKLRELVALAVSDIKKLSVCDCCQNICEDQICIDNGYMNFWWKHTENLKELGILR